MTPLSPSSLSGLASRLDRVRALARHLVRDAAAADDLVQDAVAVALRHRVPLDDDSEGWLKTVVRNLVVDGRRRQVARDDRERATARREATSDTAEAVTRAERSKDLVEAVLSLDEALREVVILRFFEEMAPREIVAATGLEPKVVKTRLERGLAQLRRKLESRYGDRGQWAVALLPLTGVELGKAAAAGAAAGSTATGAATGGLGLWLGLAAVLVAGVMLAIARGGAGEAPPELASIERSQGEATRAPGGGGDAAPAVAQAGRIGIGAPEHDHSSDHAEPGGSTSPAAADRAPGMGRFRVRDMDGDPVSHAKFVWTGPTLATVLRSSLGLEAERVTRELSGDADGWVELQKTGGALLISGEHLRVSRRSWTLVQDGTEADGTPVVVIGPSIQIAGRILRHDGTPAVGARVSVNVALNALSTFPLQVDTHYGRPTRRTTTDASGAFALDDVPRHADFEIEVVEANDTTIRSFALPPTDDLGLELRLPQSERASRGEARPSMYGRVTDHDGAPLPGARVFVGQTQTITDGNGEYRLQPPYWSTWTHVVAQAADGRFAARGVPEYAAAHSPEGAGPLDFQLPARMGQLVGQVVNADGKPVVGVKVALLGAMQDGSSSTSLEAPQGKSGERGFALTDRRGIFRFRNLLPHGYHVRILDPETLFVHDELGVEPSAGLRRIVLPDDRFVPSLEGQVVDVYGAPIAGATLALHAVVADWGRSQSYDTRGLGVTDASGAFRLENVPTRGLELDVSTPNEDMSGGPRVVLDDIDPSTPLRIEVDLICELILQVVDAPGLTHVRVLDAEGERIRVEEQHAGRTSMQHAAQRRKNGTFPLARVSQRAATLVLMAGSTELRRVPVRLDPSKRTVVSL